MKRVLVVDDAATVRLYHRSILESAGYIVDEAFNGVEALEKALQNAYDLFLVDVNMPKLDGLAFLERLRRLEIPQAPAIMISTEAEHRDSLAALTSGANSYLVKPIKPPQLLAHVRWMTGKVDL